MCEQHLPCLGDGSLIIFNAYLACQGARIKMVESAFPHASIVGTVIRRSEFCKKPIETSDTSFARGTKSPIRHYTGIAYILVCALASRGERGKRIEVERLRVPSLRLEVVRQPDTKARHG